MSQLSALLRILVALVFASSVLVKASSGQGVEPAALSRAEALLHMAIEEGKFAGAAHMVWMQGKTLHFEVAGMADIESGRVQRPDDLMLIASMTKPVTAVTAMILFEQGMFQLDDPIHKYIPAFANSEVIVEDGDGFKRVPANRPITVRDVVSHSTGLGYGGKVPNYDRVSRHVAQFYNYPNRKRFFPDMTVKEFADELASIPLVHQPGEQFTYGWNSDLLGRLVEIWTDKPLDEAMREVLFVPLTMDDSMFFVPPEKRDRYAPSYFNKDGKLHRSGGDLLIPIRKQPYLSGGGGLVTTMPDFAKFCQVLVDQGMFREKRILRPETLKLMFAKQVRSDYDAKGDVGLGFSVSHIELGKNKRQATIHGWNGYTAAYFRVVPGERLFQIFMGHTESNNDEFRDRLFNTIFEGVK